MNIAEILKNKPFGIQLYSPVFGELQYENLIYDPGEYTILTYNEASSHYLFMSDGRYNKNGESMLFPSKEMRDWEKFSWKKGDVLISGEDLCVFKEFAHSSYLTFKGKFLKKKEKEPEKFQTCLCDTRNWVKAGDIVSKKYYQDFYKFLGSKYRLNKEELRLEKILTPLPDFKDGDIITIESHYINDKNPVIETYIFDGYEYENDEKRFHYHVGYAYHADVKLDYDSYFISKDTCVHKDTVRFATVEEKQHLFEELEKKGKKWNPEKKIIEDIWTPKPFDKVLVRCNEADKWSIDFFSHIDKGHYICSGDNWFKYCLPYNEETAKLIGTTDEE